MAGVSSLSKKRRFSKSAAGADHAPTARLPATYASSTQVVSLLAAGPCPAWRQSPRRCTTSARQVDGCLVVTFLASKVHLNRRLFPVLQLFDQRLEVLQLMLHALMRIEGIPGTPVLPSVPQRV